ncbi:MAG: glycosyltransferase family 2 protein, partial [Bacilli bacterium]
YLNNEAVKIANGEYILLLNNDIEVISENWLEAMLGYARLNDIGAVGALLYYPNDTIQHCGVIAGLGGAAGHCYSQFPRQKEHGIISARVPTNFSAVTAACLMVSKDKFIEVGMLNEVELKVAFNDVDFCFKLLESGYRNIVHSGAKLYHYESISRGKEDTDEKRKRFASEARYLKLRHSEIIDNDKFYNYNLSKVHDNRLRIISEENKNYK